MIRSTHLLAALLMAVSPAISCASPSSVVSGAGYESAAAPAAADRRDSPTVTRTYASLPAFSSVSVSTGFDVRYRTGSSRNVTIEVSEDVLDHVKVEVDNGCLVIGLENWRGNRGKKIVLEAQVTGPSLHSVTVSSGADVEVLVPMSGKSLRLSASSGGDIELAQAVKYTSVDITASSGADIEVNGLQATDITVSSSSGADIEVKGIRAKAVRASASSGADISLAGTADAVSLSASSAADIDAATLRGTKGSASASSGADISCNIASISVSKSSGGSVKNRR